jgi:hypothetical protein
MCIVFGETTVVVPLLISSSLSDNVRGSCLPQQNASAGKVSSARADLPAVPRNNSLGPGQPQLAVTTPAHIPLETLPPGRAVATVVGDCDCVSFR